MNIDNGYEITDSFEARDAVPFEIERIGPTRIYPPAKYEMKLKIKANQDFNGEVIESVPESFDIVPDSKFQILNSRIIWQVDLREGETFELKYTFDAPDISPFIYLLGPLKIGDFQEIRQWQIASDAMTEDFNIQRRCETPAAAIGTVTLTAGTDYTAPADNTKAFIRLVSTRLSGMGPLTAGATQEADDVTWYISDPDFAGGSVAFTRAGTAIDARFCWEIIEYIGLGGGTNEMIVRDVGAVTYTSTGLTVDGSTVSGVVNDNDVVVFITGQNSVEIATQGQVGAGLSTAEWVSVSDIPRFTRGTHQSDANSISYAVVEFTGSNWGVERIQHQFTLAGTTEMENITDVGDTSRAFFHAQFRGATVAGLDEYGAEMWFSATNETSFLLQSGATTPSDKYGVIWIIRNSDTTSETKMNVQHLNGTRNTADISEGAANEEDEWSVAITEISATTTASIMGESDRSAGNGTTWPRGWISLYLNSKTTVKLYHADDGQQQNYRFQVVEWPASISGPLTSQLHYRWRDDTIDLNTSDGWLAVEDSNTIGDITKNNTYRLRIEVANIGTQVESASRTYELQWGSRSGLTSCSQVTTWTGIANTSDEFDMVGTTYIDPDGESVSPAYLANTEGYTYVTGEGRDTADTTSSIGPLTNSYYTELEYSFKATEDAVTGRTYCFRLYDTTAGAVLDSYPSYPRLTISSVLVAGATVMEWGTQSNVSDDGWSTINFNNTFTNPVFICTVEYNNNIGNEVDCGGNMSSGGAGDADSVVCRAQNVGSGSAQVRIQEPGEETTGCLAQSETIHWLVVEEGVYETDDIKIEAFTYTSTVTDYKTSYTGESQSYGQSYTEPVVLGQVMTYSDLMWSIFWAGGSQGTTASLPSPSVLYTGKHVGEDPDTTRSNETIGVVVIEEMHGNLGTIEFEAGIQGQTIERIDDSPNDTYTFNESFSSTPPTVALVSQAGISGGDGPHPVLYGSSPLTVDTINPTIMEDEVFDTDQGGNTEAVSYMAFSSAGSYAINTSSLDQTTYRFYENADSVQPGSPLAAENTSITNVEDDNIFRIRIAVQVGVQDLATSSQSFKLQYGEGSICSSISTSTWYDVGQAASSTIWRGNIDNTTPSDGDTITASLLNSQNNILESYEEENNSVSNSTMIAKGSRGEWDWVVENNGASSSTDYCFRMVTSDDAALQYTNYPKLTTGAGVALIVDDVQLNSQVAIDLIENTTKSVSATADISHPTACNLITNVLAKIYRSGVTNDKDCTPDNNDCYSVASCSETSCSGTDAVYTCTIDMQFHADPTDESAEYWRAWVEATDGSLTGSDYSPADAPDVNTLSALNIDLGSIDYSTVDPDNISSVKTIEVQTTGNAAIDVKLSGTNMTWSGNTILVGQQKYSTSTGFNWETEGAALTGIATCHELSSGKPTQSPTNATENVYWKLKVPTGKPAGGPYTGSNTFDAASESSCP